MIKPRDFFRIEPTGVGDSYIIRELVCINELWSISSRRWLYVTGTYPTDNRLNAKLFTWKEATDFLKTVDSNGELED